MINFHVNSRLLRYLIIQHGGRRWQGVTKKGRRTARQSNKRDKTKRI